MRTNDRIAKLLPWRHVVITGAAQGLGRALSDSCAEAGMSVSMIDNNITELKQSCRELNLAGGRAEFYHCDVSSTVQVAEAFHRLLETAGPPDAVFCCAAIGDSYWKKDFMAERLQRVLNVNVLGIANCMECALPSMQANGGGSFIMISSLLDARGYAGTASYSISKAALRAMADGTRVLLQSSGIKSILVRPGFMQTGMAVNNTISMPGMLSASAAAEQILHGIVRGRHVISFPRWLALVAALARLLPISLFDSLVRYGMKLDGEEADLDYRPIIKKECINADT